MKILSIDDSITIQYIVKNAAKVVNVDVLSANSSDHAEKVLSEKSAEIGLILLDHNMPGRSGIELLRDIKCDERYRDIPVIMLTSESGEKMLKTAIEAGAVGHISKPFSQEDLVTNIMPFFQEAPQA